MLWFFYYLEEWDKEKNLRSDSCRMKWWNSHQELVNRKAEYIFVCRNCGRLFTAYGNKERNIVPIAATLSIDTAKKTKSEKIHF